MKTSIEPRLAKPLLSDYLQAGLERRVEILELGLLK
jgi:hypothetical protein